MVSLLKGAGYAISTLSVCLLGAVTWRSASDNPLLLTGLIGGMTLSIAGMALRWMSHRLDQKQQTAQAAQDAPPRTRLNER